jgi:hypothetical protein
MQLLLNHTTDDAQSEICLHGMEQVDADQNTSIEIIILKKHRSILYHIKGYRSLECN